MDDAVPNRNILVSKFRCPARSTTRYQWCYNIDIIDIENEYQKITDILGDFVFGVEKHPKSEIKFTWFVLSTFYTYSTKRQSKYCQNTATFSMRDGILNIALKFFPQKSPHRLNESEKPGFGGTFFSISVVLLGRLFTKTIGFTHGWAHTYPVNFFKISSKPQPISCM